MSVLRYRGLCNSLGCFIHAKNSWLTLTLSACTYVIVSQLSTAVLCISSPTHEWRHQVGRCSVAR